MCSSLNAEKTASGKVISTADTASVGQNEFAYTRLAARVIAKIAPIAIARLSSA